MSRILSSHSAQLGLAGLAYAALAVVANGYLFGVDDHAVHLVFLDLVQHPESLDGDLLAKAVAHHHSLFWTLQAPFADALGVAQWTCVLYLLSLVATGAAIYHLAIRLWARPATAALSLLLLAPAQFALGGVDTLDPLLLNRTVVLPLELLAIALLYGGRPLLCFAALGLAANLHVPSASAVAAALIGSQWTVLRGGPRRDLLAPLLCPLLALPVILPWLSGLGTGIASMVVDPPWRAVLEARMAHHLFAASWHPGEWARMAFWLALGGTALSLKEQKRARRFVLTVIAGLSGWAVLAGVLLGDWLGISLALQLEPWQAFRCVTILCAMAGVAAVVELPRRGVPRLLVALALLGLLVASLNIEERATSRLLPWGEADEVASIGSWLAEHSEPGDRVMVPPVGMEQLRRQSMRPQNLSWKDGGEALFSRHFALSWKRDMERSCACRPFDEPLPARASPGVRLAELRARLAAGYALRSAKDLEDGARMTRSRYVVARSGLDLQGSRFVARYSGPSWTVYSTASAGTARSIGSPLDR